MTSRLLTLLAASLLSLPVAGFAQVTKTTLPQPAPSQAAQAPLVFKGITEDQIRAQLNGKLLFLRGFYLDDNLKFNENGQLIGSSRKGSFTLCAVDIKKIHLTKHDLELEGDRYGLHFYGALPYEDESKPFDRVRLTGKKSRSVKISIERELVVIPKVKKPKKGDAKLQAKAATPGKPTTPGEAAASDSTASEDATASKPTPTLTAVDVAPETSTQTDPGNSNGRTTTSSPAHSAKLLEGALANIFADRIDEKMMATLPDYWQFYYQEKVNRKEFKPADPSVQRVGGEVSAPRLLNGLEPGSNEFAQANGIAGLTVFRTVVDKQGKPTEIAIARPIGFGLDEKAVEAIRNSRFKPATKDGEPVPAMVDVVVTFRIYSNRTRGGQVAEPGIKPAMAENTAPPTNGARPGNGR
ncbi:MAG TPA: energy transducer TonB [Acidisarcina sp.]|nr:energy transducer TonB [Acidisarcina sp.]